MGPQTIIIEEQQWKEVSITLEKEIMEIIMVHFLVHATKLFSDRELMPVNIGIQLYIKTNESFL